MVTLQKILDLDDSIILILAASEDNRINGRTAIQKVAYFCVNSLNIDNDFIPHYFGPYSASVDSALGRLVSFALVHEVPVLTQNGRTMYYYSLTTDGLTYSRKLITIFRAKYRVIKKVVGAFEKIGGNRINRLACAAKIHYLARVNRDLTVESAIQQAKSLGWELNEKEIINAVNTLKSLPTR
jgi:uncharacterized protein